MADWLKILISALSGVAVGLILEPLKHHFMGRVIARKARRAIYHELGGMYRGFCLTQHESEEFYARCFKHGVLDDGTFWYYRNHYRDAFYGLKEWEPIEDIYSAFRVIKQQVMDGTKSSVAGAADFREEFHRSFELGLDATQVLFFAKRIRIRQDNEFLDTKRNQ